jgi:hypothetical protein
VKLILTSATLLAVLVTNANAALTVFTDRATWEAALGGATPVVEDLNDVTPFSFKDGQRLETSKLAITRDGGANGSDGALDILDGASFGTIDGTNFLDGETGVEPHEVVDIGFLGASAFAFGSDFTSPFSGDGIALDVLGELVLLDSIAGFDTGFVGVVSDMPFESVSIVGTPDAISFQELWSADNLSYAAVPEPTSLAALLFGLAALALRRRS